MNRNESYALSTGSDLVKIFRDSGLLIVGALLLITLLGAVSTVVKPSSHTYPAAVVSYL